MDAGDWILLEPTGDCWSPLETAGAADWLVLLDDDAGAIASHQKEEKRRTTNYKFIKRTSHVPPACNVTANALPAGCTTPLSLKKKYNKSTILNYD